MSRFALLLAVAVAWPGFAAAAPEASDYSARQTRALMHDYARCVVGRQARKASQAMIANVGNGEILRGAYRTLIVPDCLKGEAHFRVSMSFKGDLYRYALADALVNRELAASPAPDLAAVPPLSHPQAGTEPRPTDARGRRLSARKYQAATAQFEEQSTFAFLSRYGECVVRRAPAEARALVLAAPDSAEETARFGALRPALETCMPEGRSIRFGRVALRGSIAINYYRLAHAARAASGTAG